MAITVTVQESYTQGNHKVKQGTIAMDSSYLTGGEVITAADLGLSQIRSLFLNPHGGYVFEYVPTQTGGASVDGTIKAYWTGSTTAAALAQVSSTTNLASSAASIPFIATGH